MIQSLFKLEKAVLLKEDFQMNPYCNMQNQKVQQKLILETQTTLLSTEKKILLMARNSVDGQTHSDGPMMEQMMK